MSTTFRSLASAFRHPASAVWLLPLAFLWYRLLAHLRVEWTLNPQYNYGWAVPFLCLYLLWQRIQNSEVRRQKPAVSPLSSALRPPASGLWVLLFALCALLYAPTRLIQEANPEWRLVSWALALEVIGLTLLMLCEKSEVGRQKAEGSRPSSVICPLVFPVCFFLVAVPWPTLIEGPLIQGLTRANAGAAVELLDWLGIPAVQHGNVIEVASGVVGIDEACSGIRSLQATLMISLFLGEFYALGATRRALCVLLGFSFAFGFNVVRTGLLTWVAARKGVPAIASWHDPAGVTILVACFLGLWATAGLLARDEARRKAQSAKPEGQCAEHRGALECGDLSPLSPSGDSPTTLQSQAVPSQSAVKPAHSKSAGAWRVTLGARPWALRTLFLALAIWLVLVEVGVEAWYRLHERGLPPPVEWTVKWPRENPSFRELPLTEAARRNLRPAEASNATWEQDGAHWQAVFLRWNPGRIAVHLAQGHTPEICLPASGRKLAAISELEWYPVHGLALPFRRYTVANETPPLHVFHCLWEDRFPAQGFAAGSFGYASRLGPVLAGRRNTGQRELQIAVWGFADADAAEAAVRQELEKLIVVEK